MTHVSFKPKNRSTIEPIITFAFLFKKMIGKIKIGIKIDDKNI